MQYTTFCGGDEKGKTTENLAYTAASQDAVVYPDVKIYFVFIEDARCKRFIYIREAIFLCYLTAPSFFSITFGGIKPSHGLFYGVVVGGKE